MEKRTVDPQFFVWVGTAVVCAIILVLDIFGIWDQAPWLTARIPTITLVLVSTTLVYLIVERRNKLNSIEALVQAAKEETQAITSDGIERVITALQGVNIQLYDDRDSMFVYLERRIKSAKRSIDVTHMEPSTPSREEGAGQRYYETYLKVLSEGKIRVRRIVVVRDLAQLQWVREMLAVFPKRQFILGCYPKPSVYVPTPDIMIIDGEEICLGGGERTRAYRVKAVSVRHPFLTQVIQEHFDKLWGSAMILNEEGVRNDFLMELEKALQ